ncbi:MAG: MCE family protein [Phormidium sp. GEM2.Bin31]|nr:MCE family protein [Phormidium sp. BM_Day4_Bin.17]TVR13136.1 MAG: MCE family protein [Phormidium sp. GEM2.Bin31]UCJ11878.1 MAG: MCE family protein [Phormidium sp. PBR-2020]
MRSRTLREGSLGLFILLGLGLFGVLSFWLRGVTLGRQTYEFVVEFEDALGMQAGAPVRYRGVRVGRLVDVVPGTNGVDAKVEILSGDLKIPRPPYVEANQVGFIGETTIDILAPDQPLPQVRDLAVPRDSDCDPQVIICHGDRVLGRVGISFEKLTRASTEFTESFSDPELLEAIQRLLENTAQASEDIAGLARNVSEMTMFFQEELGVLSDSALVTTETLTRTAQEFGTTAETFNQTAVELNRLTATANQLVEDNRTSLVMTLDNLNVMSRELRLAASGITPLLQQSDRTLSLVNENLSQLEQANLIADLQVLVNNATVLSENAAVASQNLRDVSEAVNDPANLMLLQETLSSARSTFENVEKITADLDDLTGDPQLRENLRRLINGLSGLVSLSDQLEQDTQLAQALAVLDEQRKQLEAAEQERLQKRQLQPPARSEDPNVKTGYD